MPEDNQMFDNDDSQETNGSAPEPPAGWNKSEHPFVITSNAPDDAKTPVRNGEQRIGEIGITRITLNDREAVLFGSARKHIIASQIMALVSLVIGGVVLSGAAIFVAYLGYGKLRQLAETHAANVEAYKALVRSGKMAIGMCVVALVLNIIALVMLYSLFSEALRNGDLSAMFPFLGSQNAPSPSGSSLFG